MRTGVGRVAPLLALGAAGLLAAGAARAQRPPTPARPNVVLILADDLGYGDLGCTGAPDIRTPEIDRIAAEGLRFTMFYSNGPECTPTRAALLTGRYPQRPGGLECAIGVGNVGRYDDAVRLRETRELGLPPDRSVLAQMFKRAGYATGLIGKWHLGYEPHLLPRRHGFDEFFGPIGGSVDYFRHTEPDGTPMLYRNEERVQREGYMTDLIAAEASDFIRRRKGGPFFLYVPFTAPHDPFQTPDSPEPRPGRATYAAMVERLDRGVGQVLKTLEEQGLTRNTVVIFSSDNGGPRYARNAPYTRGKGTTFEGGIRVPCFVRWPGVLAPGSTSAQVGITMDLTASLAGVLGAAAPEGKPFDGIDVLKRAREGAAPQPRTLFWRIRRGEATRWGARDGSLKYVRERDGERRGEFLFDVERDPAEKTDLLAERPAEVERLRGRLAAWETEVRPTR